MINCQDCGRIVYWDNEMKEPVEGVDDISAPPYITESGDLFCCLCGPKYDEIDEEEYDGWEDPMDELYEKEAKKENAKNANG